LESVKDEKVKIKIKCLKDNRSLYDLPQNKYESFIRRIGIIVYGCGDHLAEFQFDMKQKPMLDSIEQILYEARPSPNAKKIPRFKEIYAQRENEYKALVPMFIQKLRDHDDQQLTSDIQWFLENKHTLNTDPKYQYEFIFMHLGAMSYNDDMLKNMKPILNSDDFQQLEDGSKQDLRDYVPEVLKLYNKHEKIVADMLESMEDQKLKIKIKCLKDTRCLHDLPQYKYEYFIKTIGIIVYGYGDHLAEF